MAKYRKKPVVVQAEEFTGSSTSATAITRWMEGGEFRKPGISTRDLTDLVIPTLEGDMVASPGDMIIKGVEGEFYPCKPSVFKETYELVDEEPRPVGDYPASRLEAGDVIEIWGKKHTLIKVQSTIDAVRLTLDDNSIIDLRPWTEVLVVEVGV